ncbi:sugar ABC transporter ATP-binding protein [Rhizobium laguerreae]|uniref:sugar ABC transporter ATP-binding protein n=1 Tax=Rhizobium laguerreae TaxID=1076926 RepID=UPI001C905504|nr:sugar ABC transporter ATP-binding protein [Rhizobium laguerreae]MBY3307656.1 sugar ABC transporter ATP-binding protein [Rhizobium laguerreae]
MTNEHGSADSVRLSVRGLAKRFGSIAAIEDVSLDLHRGEVRALCGGNGAGKSTLVKILTGVLIPSEGTLDVDGQTRHFRNPIDAQRAGLTLVAQELSLAPDLSVHDNLWLGHASAPFARRTAQSSAMAREALDTVGLESTGLDVKARDLALAERQLLEIARGLVRNASVLILDEPTATLSEREIGKVFDAVRQLKARNCSVIYITHRMGEVYELCDSVTVMRNGRIVTTQPVTEMPRDRLLELMIGRELTDVYPQATRKPGEVMLDVSGLQVPGTIDGFDITLRAGEIVGVVGQIGSGATESIRALAGLVHNARGDVAVGGRKLRLGAPASVLRSGVRFVSEDRASEGVFLDKPAHTNLVATRLAEVSSNGLLPAGRLVRIAGVLAQQVGFDPARLHLAAGRLSGGNQQKLAIGRCSDRRMPGVILMNEPTRGVDMGARAEIYQTLRRLCDDGNAVLLASTDLEEVVGLVDRVVTMFRGRIVGVHQRGAFTETAILSEITNAQEAAA